MSKHALKQMAMKHVERINTEVVNLASDLRDAEGRCAPTERNREALKRAEERLWAAMRVAAEMEDGL